MSRARAGAGMLFHAVAAGLAAAGLTACFAAAGPPLERYRLRPPSAPGSADSLRPASARPAALDGWVVVEPYLTPGLYADPQIVYRIGEVLYGSYSNREWALPLSGMLSSLTLDVLRGSATFGGRVSDDPTVLRTDDLVWRGKVGEFEEVDRGERVSVAVQLDVTILRASDDSVLWRGATRLERLVREPTMAAIVDGLSALAAEATARLVREAEGAVYGYASRRMPADTN